MSLPLTTPRPARLLLLALMALTVTLATPSHAHAATKCGAANFYGYPVFDITGSGLSCSAVRRAGVSWAHVALDRVQSGSGHCDLFGDVCFARSGGRRYRCRAGHVGGFPLPRVRCKSGAKIAAWTFSGDL